MCPSLSIKKTDKTKGTFSNAKQSYEITLDDIKKWTMPVWELLIEHF